MARASPGRRTHPPAPPTHPPSPAHLHRHCALDLCMGAWVKPSVEHHPRGGGGAQEARLPTQDAGDRVSQRAQRLLLAHARLQRAACVCARVCVQWVLWVGGAWAGGGRRVGEATARSAPPPSRPTPPLAHPHPQQGLSLFPHDALCLGVQLLGGVQAAGEGGLHAPCIGGGGGCECVRVHLARWPSPFKRAPCKFYPPSHPPTHPNPRTWMSMWVSLPLSHPTHTSPQATPPHTHPHLDEHVGERALHGSHPRPPRPRGDALLQESAAGALCRCGDSRACLRARAWGGCGGWGGWAWASGDRSIGRATPPPPHTHTQLPHVRCRQRRKHAHTHTHTHTRQQQQAHPPPTQTHPPTRAPTLTPTHLTAAGLGAAPAALARGPAGSAGSRQMSPGAR